MPVALANNVQLFWPLPPKWLTLRLNAPQQVEERGLQLDDTGTLSMPPEQSFTVREYSLPSEVQASDVPLRTYNEETVRLSDFELAYQALSDRRGINATPAGRTASRRVWTEAGAEAARWLIERLRTEEHLETMIGIAETITEMGAVALPLALEELEREEVLPKHATLIEALSWMAQPLPPLLLSRVACLVDRYLASSNIDCQVAAVQLTRILDANATRSRLDAALGNARPRLREEIEDMLSERFNEDPA